MRAPVRAEQLYELDFYAWTRAQAREIRRFARLRPNVPIDLRHVAEEVAGLGKDRRDALRSWATQVMIHALMLAHSPAREPRLGWEDEIGVFRLEIRNRLTATLRRDLARRLPSLYADARREAVRKLARHGERGASDALPATCPYTLDQVIGDWWPPPEPPGG